MTSAFKDGTGGCAGWPGSPGFLDYGGHSGVSLAIFVLYSINSPSEALLLTSK